MDAKTHSIVIMWAGVIDAGAMADQDNIRMFQSVGVDDVPAIIGQLDFSTISAVISAPGIAAETRRLIPVPLVIAYPNYIDILETVKYAEARRTLENKKIALILHEDNRIDEGRLRHFINRTIDLFTYRTKADMRLVFERLARHDYALVVGGPTAVGMAAGFDLDAVQLVYREQALQDAVEKTREILSLMDKEIRQRERLDAIIDIIPEGLLETDAAGTIGLCNKRALEMLGLSRDQVLGANVCQLLGDPTWEKVYGQDAVQVDTLFTYKRNSFFSTRQPIQEGGRTIGSVGTLQEAAKIQGMESKFRLQRSRGLVARYTFDDIVCESPIMREIVERTKIYTRCDTTILIEGETGTGKEIFAQSIHNASARKHGPFVAINCAALPDTLLESELMGYDEGAFTGARKGGKTGLFEQAHKGTIFLDEINQLSPSLQSKLLRIVQEKTVRHVGGESVIPVDVRIITATNENLKGKIAAQTFRSDLYYRINVLNITLPPLRERRADIPVLLRHFARKLAGGGRDVERHAEAMHALVRDYDWPGNIRELQNFVERYLVLCERVDRLDRYFFHEFQRAAHPAPLPADATLVQVPLGTLDDMQRELIEAVVARCDGNKSKAAQLMNISRNTLHQRMKGRTEKRGR
ncbi:sigma 54-interacting transcriptional regulator [Rhodoplanes sp. TEM]|uniref:Sigma 54-interacting transcriptional regulator n=1 Tax=Rhodoplanes tepidamans TaxID=200616 RepID=A0ABT5JH02_RHOTP|nr:MULTISPECIES: sigma 54-interacting transcriptional regulator [Rhodoplanes]MDC7788882.1 sigma 54-interacting transcriptional regulator [Rhodoplanes tepidamans]MDC7987509.1 sigma 54-interacting transcriptional regulator [Rhodoplanes sp. TEM]MDQ0355118.1 transcriptional regulator with PAS, ATPase and Fis domain [Rhodoplanes tepidamans]